MGEPSSSQKKQGASHAPIYTDLTELEGDPTPRAKLRIELEPLLERRRRSLTSVVSALISTLIGAFASLGLAALTASQIPGNHSSTSLKTILIIVAGLVVLFAVGLIGFVFYGRLKARRLERLESLLSGPDLRAINSFVTRELELLSTLGEGDAG